MLAIVPWLLALVAGYFLTAWIAARVRGAAGFFLLLAWFFAPYVGLWLLLASTTDPAWEPERAAYNQSFAFALVAIAMTLPWLLVFLFAVQRGRNRRRAADAAAPVAAQPASPPQADAGLPDWNKADNPRLSLAALEQLMTEKARKGGIDPELLPTFGPPPAGGEGEFVFEDKFDFVYLGLERGQPLFEHAAVVADRMCYTVLRDRARALAANRIAGTAADEYGTRLAAEQQAILATIDPRWGRQFAHEQERKA